MEENRKKQRPPVSDFIELEIVKDSMEWRQRTIDRLYRHAGSFAVWSNIISSLALDELHRKKRENLPSDAEEDVFIEASGFFTRLSSCKEKLSVWNEELKQEIEKIDRMIDDEIEKQENGQK